MEWDKPAPLKLVVTEIKDKRLPSWMSVHDTTENLKISVGFKKLWFMQMDLRIFWGSDENAINFIVMLTAQLLNY